MTTLIIGGTGKTGSRVASRLTSIGHPTRVGSRSRGTRFDWDCPSTWAPALEACDSAYITYRPALAKPDGVRRALGREPRDFTDYVRRSAEMGVWNG
jgi:nucleoside-diphosphate-sugar epimerase